MTELNRISAELNKVVSRIATNFKKDNIKVVMPTYIPQRGEILSELSDRGVDTAIAGGIKGERCFKNVRQYGMEGGTASHVDKFDITKEIVGLFPDHELQNKKIAVFSYVNSFDWSKEIKDRGLNTEIVGTVEQNLRNYFEEKGNLVKILKTAGLDAYVIPTEKVTDKTSDNKLKEVYRTLKNEDGKVVLQDCGSGVANAGGKGTIFVDNEKDFLKAVKEVQGERKVAKFVKGFESNMSFFAGNTVPAKEELGAKKMRLTSDMDQYNPDTLDKILENAKKSGINENNIVAIAGRGTLKAVGDENLTNCEANGVGNDVGFVYDEKTQKQIKEIGEKLSKLMALSGKVGLAGCDLIVDKTGKIWINEINDRQQGPTAQMSKDAEKNGLPSLLKIALVANYGDMNDDSVKNLMTSLQKESSSINHAYMNNKGEFYLKVQANHKDGEYEEVRHNLAPGYYDLVKDEKGKFRLDYSSYRNPKENIKTVTDPSKDKMTVKLEGGDLKKGDKIKAGTQLFRLTGEAEPGNPPFIVKEGKTKLNSSWQNVVEACYEHVFYEGYTKQNPLLLKREQERQVEEQKKINFVMRHYIAARSRGAG